MIRNKKFILFCNIAVFLCAIFNITSILLKKQEKATIKQKQTDLIKEHEGLRLEEYGSVEDSNKKVVCYGNSKYDFKEHFGDRKPTEELCDSLVEKKKIDILLKMQDDELELNKNQEEALISLIYNLRGGYRVFSATNLYQHIRYGVNDANTIKNIIKEWMDICRVNKQISKGLLNRRQRELSVYFKDYKDKDFIYYLIDKEYKKLLKGVIKCKN